MVNLNVAAKNVMSNDSEASQEFKHDDISEISPLVEMTPIN